MTHFDLGPRRRSRRPSLTPMIDVVFLLLVFFMLAARFGAEGDLPLTLAGPPSDWTGPPRLIDILPDSLRLNGLPVTVETLPDALAALSDSPAHPILLRPAEGTGLQRLVTVIETLTAAGHSTLAVIE